MQRFDRHQVADTRIAVHVQHPLDKGCKQVFIRTVDTDVLVILIGLFHGMIHVPLSGLVKYGKIYPIHQCEFRLRVS